MKSLVLVCSFARNPFPTPGRWRGLLSAAPVWAVPDFLVSRFTLGKFWSSSLANRLTAATSRVNAVAWRARIGAVLGSNVTDALDRIEKPVLYLRATRDRLVPKSAGELIMRHLRRGSLVEIDAPHFLLQTKPHEAAAAIAPFARETANAF